MRIKMFTVAAGETFKAEAGQTIDVSEELASQLVAGGYAGYVDIPKKVATVIINKEEQPAEEIETASYEPATKAVKAKPKPKTRK